MTFILGNLRTSDANRAQPKCPSQLRQTDNKNGSRLKKAASRFDFEGAQFCTLAPYLIAKNSITFTQK